MKPLIWLNGGEYLVGERIEKLFPACDVWVPVKDTGTDLLVSSKSDRRKTAGVQVKYTKDFLPAAKEPALQKGLLARGWFNLPATKSIKANNADVWVLALYSWELRRPKCLVLTPAELARRLKDLGLDGKLQLCITKDEHCFVENGIPQAGLIKAASGDFQPLLNGKNDFSAYLENWPELGAFI